MKPYRTRLSAFVVVGVLLAACGLHAAPPSTAPAPGSDVLRLAPPDAGLYVMVRDLRTNLRSFMQAPFVRAFRRSTLGRTLLAAPEVQKLREVEGFFEKCLGVGWQRLVDDVLGDEVLLAYRPGPVGRPEEEEGVLLVRARDPELLAQIIERINAAQTQAGEISQIETRRHGGGEYICRLGGTKNGDFYYLRGPVLAYSSQESAIQRVVARDRQPDSGPMPAVADQMRRLGADTGLATLWINPRAFDAHLANRSGQLPLVQAAVARAIFGYWKALDGVAVGISLGKNEVEGRLAFLVRASVLPPAARKLFRADNAPCGIWSRFPEESMLTVGGRFDGAALREFVSGFLSEDLRRSLSESIERRVGAVIGKDIEKDVLPCLGPDWGLSVTAPPRGSKDWFPRVIWALGVRHGNKEPGVDQTLLSALSAFAMMAVFGYNSAHADALTLNAEQQGPVTVQYLASSSLFPAGVRPAFALKGGYLLVASDPAAIRSFGEAPSGRQTSAALDAPFLRLSIQELRRFLVERHETLTAHIAEKDRRVAAEVGARLSNLVDALELFDRIEISHQAGADRLTIKLQLRALLPMRSD